MLINYQHLQYKLILVLGRYNSDSDLIRDTTLHTQIHAVVYFHKSLCNFEGTDLDVISRHHRFFWNQTYTHRLFSFSPHDNIKVFSKLHVNVEVQGYSMYRHPT